MGGRKRGVTSRAGRRDPVKTAAASCIGPLVWLSGGPGDVVAPAAVAEPTPPEIVEMSDAGAAPPPPATLRTLPKIVRSMLSMLWKLAGNCSDRGSGGVADTCAGTAPVVVAVVVVAALVVVGGRDAVVVETAALATALVRAGWLWGAVTGTRQLRDVVASSARVSPEQYDGGGLCGCDSAF